MESRLVFDKGSYNSWNVNANLDLTGQTVVSQIRVRPEETSDLILQWTVSITDAAAGEFTIYFNDSANTLGDVSEGFMDIKRVTGSGDVRMHDEVIFVEFQARPTA